MRRRGSLRATETTGVVVEEPQVVIHKAQHPDSIADFYGPDVLTGEHRAQIDLAASEADAAALSDGDGAVVEGIVQRIEPVIRAW